MTCNLGEVVYGIAELLRAVLHVLVQRLLTTQKCKGHVIAAQIDPFQNTVRICKSMIFVLAHASFLFVLHKRISSASFAFGNRYIWPLDWCISRSTGSKSSADLFVLLDVICEASVGDRDLHVVNDFLEQQRVD